MVDTFLHFLHQIVPWWPRIDTKHLTLLLFLVASQARCFCFSWSVWGRRSKEKMQMQIQSPASWNVCSPCDNSFRDLLALPLPNCVMVTQNWPKASNTIVFPGCFISQLFLFFLIWLQNCQKIKGKDAIADTMPSIMVLLQSIWQLVQGLASSVTQSFLSAL